MSAHTLLARFVHLHPAVWQIAWNATARATFLLPHDRTYLAFRHFIALQPGGLFLDVGANNGVSVRSFRKLDPIAPVVSLEPNPLLEPSLYELTQTDDLVSYRMVAAGDQARRLTLYVPQYGRVSLHPLAAVDHKQAIDGGSPVVRRSHRTTRHDRQV